jgi:hypothetical protein
MLTKLMGQSFLNPNPDLYPRSVTGRGESGRDQFSAGRCVTRSMTKRRARTCSAEASFRPSCCWRASKRVGRQSRPSGRSGRLRHRGRRVQCRTSGGKYHTCPEGRSHHLRGGRFDRRGRGRDQRWFGWRRGRWPRSQTRRDRCGCEIRLVRSGVDRQREGGMRRSTPFRFGPFLAITSW